MPSIRIVFNNEDVETHELDREVYIIGRQDDSDIRIDNLGISRHHARLLREGHVYAIEDLGSSNGTFVNGQQVQRHNLNDGDEITIGKYFLVYHAEAAVQRPSTVSMAQGNVLTDSGMQDSSLNTMAMDGDALRKRIEEMRKKAEGGNEGAEGAEDAAEPEESTKPVKKGGCLGVLALGFLVAALLAAGLHAGLALAG